MGRPAAELAEEELRQRPEQYGPVLTEGVPSRRLEG